MSAEAAGGAGPPPWFGRLVQNVQGLGLPPRPRPGSAGRLAPQPTYQLPEFDSPPRHSAVLVLFGVGPGGDYVLLTRRSSQLRKHAGQVAFPGGKIEPEDGGPAAAALREAAEETGLDPAGVEVHGLGGELFVPVTNFIVTPVIGWWRTPSPVAPVDAAEVDDVVAVPLAELTDPGNRFTVRHPSGYEGPGFDAGGLFIWGFTAGVLSGLLALAGIDRPWDDARSVPLDGRRAGNTRYDLGSRGEVADTPRDEARLTAEQVPE